MDGPCICGKRNYKKQDAIAIAKSLQKRDGEMMSAYKCPFRHNWWHVGHGPKFKITRRKKRYLVKALKNVG